MFRNGIAFRYAPTVSVYTVGNYFNEVKTTRRRYYLHGVGLFLENVPGGVHNNRAFQQIAFNVPDTSHGSLDE